MTAALDGAREALRHAAANYAPAYPNPGPEWDDLCRAAIAYADQRALSIGAAQRTQSYSGPRSGAVVPFGKTKGRPIEDESDKGLAYLSDAMQRSIDDPSKERWAESNRTLKAAVDAEIARRAR